MYLLYIVGRYRSRFCIVSMYRSFVVYIKKVFVEYLFCIVSIYLVFIVYSKVYVEYLLCVV